jgi:hypothetical protein
MVMDDDELIAAVTTGDDTELCELRPGTGVFGLRTSGRRARRWR